MENKFNDVVVGAFVILLTLAVSAFVVWLTVGTEKIEYTRYRVITNESVSGIPINSPVSFNGVDIGKVVSITLNKDDPRFVIIDIDLQKGTPVRSDTKAILKSKGITGLVNVSLTGGAPGMADLLPTSENPVPIIANGASLGKRIDDAFDQIVGQVSHISESLALFLNKDNALAINQILVNIQKISSNLEAKSGEMNELINLTKSLIIGIEKQAKALNLEDKNGTVANFNKTLDGIQKMTDDYSKLAKQFTGTSQWFNTTAQTANKTFTEIGPRLNSLMLDIQSTAESLKYLLNDLEKEPNSLIFGKQATKKGPGE